MYLNISFKPSDNRKSKDDTNFFCRNIFALLFLSNRTTMTGIIMDRDNWKNVYSEIISYFVEIILFSFCRLSCCYNKKKGKASYFSKMQMSLSKSTTIFLYNFLNGLEMNAIFLAENCRKLYTIYYSEEKKKNKRET